MTTTTQQIPSSPAQRLAEKILARTNNGRDLVDLLHDIAQGGYDATLYDRVTTTKFLYDRGFGKCPKQVPATSVPAPETEDIDVEPAPYSIRGALRESPPVVTHKEPKSPRLVNQLGDALHDSLGPAPKACPEPVADAQSEQAKPPPPPTRHSRESGNPVSRNVSHSPGIENSESPDPFDLFSIQSYIIEITNDGETLVDVLMDIAFPGPDDPEVTPFYRSQAGRILADRSHGTDPTSVGNGLCPSCRRKWTSHPGSHDHPEPSRVVDNTEEEPFDREVWDEIIAELKQLEEDGVITPDPNAPKYDFSNYLSATDEQVAPYADEVAAKFSADIALRVERQKQWPEIEERRRKKLAQIYPSHSEDGDPPDP